jgi:hypothetical protein
MPECGAAFSLLVRGEEEHYSGGYATPPAPDSAVFVAISYLSTQRILFSKPNSHWRFNGALGVRWNLGEGHSLNLALGYEHSLRPVMEGPWRTYNLMDNGHGRYYVTGHQATAKLSYRFPVGRNRSTARG